MSSSAEAFALAPSNIMNKLLVFFRSTIPPRKHPAPEGRYPGIFDRRLFRGKSYCCFPVGSAMQCNRFGQFLLVRGYYAPFVPWKYYIMNKSAYDKLSLSLIGLFNIIRLENIGSTTIMKIVSEMCVSRIVFCMFVCMRYYYTIFRWLFHKWIILIGGLTSKQAYR